MAKQPEHYNLESIYDKKNQPADAPDYRHLQRA